MKTIEQALKQYNLHKEDIIEISSDSSFSRLFQYWIKLSYKQINHNHFWINYLRKKITDDFSIKKDIYDVFKITLASPNKSYICYELRCNLEEKFICKWQIRSNREDFPQWWNAISILDNMIRKWEEIWCHSIYADCLSDNIHNWWYTRWVLWYDFDTDNEFWRKTKWEKHSYIININRKDLYQERNILSLHELLSQTDWKEYRKKNHFSFQWKFDIYPTSNSVQTFEKYKAVFHNK